MQFFFLARHEEILCILASGRTLAVMLSPPVSSLSVARNRPPCEARHPRGLPALKFSDNCQVARDNSCVAACLRVARVRTSFKIPVCISNPLGSYLWKLSGLKNLINKCVVLDIHHCAFGSHWRKATRLLFGGRYDRVCFHSLYFLVFRCHGKYGFQFPRRTQTLALTRQSHSAICKASSTSRSFHCWNF